MNQNTLIDNAERYLHDLRIRLQNTSNQSKQKYFAGVGHRIRGLSVHLNEQEVQNLLSAMSDVSHSFVSRGYCLRSGHADGADMAFEIGALKVNEKVNPHRAEIFNNSHIKRALKTGKMSQAEHELLMGIAAYFHPTKSNFFKLSESVCHLLMRNYFQVMGDDLDIEQTLPKPIDFALCYTNDGCETHATRSRDTGGTGQFISYADFFGIPVFNMRHSDWDIRLQAWLDCQIAR